MKSKLEKATSGQLPEQMISKIEVNQANSKACYNKSKFHAQCKQTKFLVSNLILISLASLTCFWLEQATVSGLESPTSTNDDWLSSADLLMSRPFDYHAHMPVITKRELANAINAASKRATHEAAGSGAAGSGGAWLLASSMLRRPAPSNAEWRNQSDQALISEEASRQLASQYKLNKIQTIRGLPLISVDQTSLGRHCEMALRAHSCPAARYRSLSGLCNNVQNAHWGAARTALVRYAAAAYSDGVAQPAAQALPSAGAVAAALHEARAVQPESHAHLTTMLSFFGQFVFHDLAQVVQFVGVAPGACCGPHAHPECMPVERAGACLSYVRSAPALRPGCNLGPREQLNLASSYLDGSVIYGSSERQMRRLRSFSGGRLRSQRMSGSGQVSQEVLPELRATNGSESGELWAELEHCRQMALLRQRSEPNRQRCLLAGDLRANDNLGLTLMHTIWLREHNYIADKLAELNRHWRDERLFEEARRIVVAELQQIAYSELLPNLLGNELMQRFNLSVLSQGYSQAYEPQLNGGLANELAAGVMPFILATIPATLERYSERLEMLGETKLADTFMDASELLERNRFAQYLTGLMSQSAMEPSSAMMPLVSATASQAHSSRLKRQTNANYQLNNQQASEQVAQMDALALIIQQGRDHGLQSYLFWRKVCQLTPDIQSWQDLELVMPSDQVHRLKSLYETPAQLDLYLAVLERPMAGSSLGPTFVCLLARQFFHTKHADRFWFENDLPGSGFELSQLEEIRQTSLAKVICRNSQASVQFVQPAPMLASDPFLNAYQYCTNKAMNQLDLSKWREPVNSAQSVMEEILMSELDENERLKRTKRLAEAATKLIGPSIKRAKRQLDELAIADTQLQLKRLANNNNNNNKKKPEEKNVARLKRQTLKLSNQSLILELATNELVRALLHQGRDRELAQASLQSDIRDFLSSLETVQLDNLLTNSAQSNQLSEMLASAGFNFVNDDQRRYLLELADPALAGDPAIEAAGGQRTSSASPRCLDHERLQPCDHTSQFRTATGWCNNLQRPKWGQSFTAHDRLLPSVYEDGLSKPRRWSVKLAQANSNELQALPSARLISTTMHDDRSHLHARYSLALMQFGQFGVDHDLTRTPFSVASDGSLLDCSPCDSQQSVHRECWPIEIPADDAHFESAKARQSLGPARKCLHFVRSLNGQTGLGPRQQINALTAYLDASNIYGSDNCEAKSLRAFVAGRLNSSAYPAEVAFSGNQAMFRELLPLTLANPECVTPGKLCFHAGDQRASEQPGLSAIHTVFLRLHNSIVTQLASINRHWTDERLYQQGRRIVGAISQRITFNEFAPRLLGLDYMSKFDLLLKNVGYSNHYDESCSATILNEFAAAAFRMGHSLIRSAFPLLNKQYKTIGKSFQLRKGFFNSQRILNEPNLIDAILRGIVTTPIETLDNAISEELTNHLFERPKEPFSGMDLISLNIQRARDHGIAPYNAYRVKCNLTKARNFDDLTGEIPAKLVKRLANLYASVDDIDLFTGGMSELPVHGGIIGPTLGCIIATQFARLKKCDRFWHETNDPWVRFSAPQLAEIRKMTLAKVICQESDTIDTIQRNAMDISDSYLNPRVACSSLPSMDLSVWRENTKSCIVNKSIKIELGQSKRISPCKSCTCTAEGPICRTAKISNCLQLMKQTNVKLSNIMADKSCLIQCAWALDMQTIQ